MPDICYRAALLPEVPGLEDLPSIVPDYTAMLLSVMETIADRYEGSPNIPLVDTKLNVITGEDFADDDPVKGRNAVYGWIQGRALEAIVGHCGWMRRRGIGSSLLPRLEAIFPELLAELRRRRDLNGGHIAFLSTLGGEPFTVGVDGTPVPFSLGADAPYGFSDLFTAKGMLAAAHYLEDDASWADALDYCTRVDEAIWGGRFQNDQQTLDPKNPIEPRPGQFQQGPYMIQIGSAALLAEQGHSGSAAMGLALIQHELSTYANLAGRIDELEEGDFWEAVDGQGLPLREDGAILSDPGHALEFVGLCLKFSSAVRSGHLADGDRLSQIGCAEDAMPALLRRNFANGFASGPGGIVKSYDLASRRVLNSDMPWWSLPETMRSALSCYGTARSEDDRRMCLTTFARCHNAFTRHYVQPDRNLMAVQTRSADGLAVPVIPASADADPGYHTGLSIIDVLDAIEASA